MERELLIDRIKKLSIDSPKLVFTELALDIFNYQKDNNQVYQKWISGFNHPIGSLSAIPKLHISAWKNNKVKSGHFEEEVVFESSGTTGVIPSRHFVKDKLFYIENAIKGFESVYGSLNDFCVLGLLPSYMERTGSSLVVMVEAFIKKSKYNSSGTYLYEHKELAEILLYNKKNQIPTVLIGVSFGLLDFLDNYTIDFPELIVMETGGMKGRRKEISKTALHSQLSSGFGIKKVHSEYGMTELLSQAYSLGNGIYKCIPTMKVLITEINDPLTQAPYGKAGVINIVDLANIDSCSFISSEDIGVGYDDGTFEILGRLDHSDIRGCNLMVSDL